MSCDIKYDKIIFTVQKVSRFGPNTYENYVFIGITDDIMLGILNKIEKRLNIKREEVLLLKQRYLNYYLEWIDIVKKKMKIKFIPALIQIDDSINDIRKKIFVFLSNPDTKTYILPENQELWLKKKDGSFKILGYHYVGFNIYPHINDDYKSYEKLMKDTVKDISENNMVIYDILNEDSYIKNIIYLSDAVDEEMYLKQQKINITKELINLYFKKYWTYVNLSYDIQDVKNNYLIIKDYFLRENYIFNLIDNIPIDNKTFLPFNIILVQLSINKGNKLLEDEDHDDDNKYIELFPIFDYIREDKIDEDTPFIKYYEDILESPFSIISKEAIDNNRLYKKKLKEWIGIKEEPKRNNTITIKRYLKHYNQEPRYSSISLFKSGKIDFSVSFPNDLSATFSDVELAVKNCKVLIEDINKNRITKKIDEKDKITPPDLDFKNNTIILKSNTQIIYMNIMIPLKLNKGIDFNKLHEFSKKFSYFIVDNPKNILKKDNLEQNCIRFKYKRVSSFANMNDILLDIDILKQKYDKDLLFIIKTLEKKYQKNVDEIKGYLIEWEKKFSSLRTSKIDSKYKSGITITITNENIFIQGITKVYQIPLLYNFFVNFITLFLEIDTFMKDKDFKKIFIDKNLKTDEKKYETYETYEINNSALAEIDNVDLDYELDDIDDIADYVDETLEDEDILSPSQHIVGLASDTEIEPNIKLSCDDPIPVKDTCEDFCNDKNYFLRRLQRYDNKLFKFNIDKKNKQTQFSRGCGVNQQPVVLPYDPEKNDKIKRDSYSYSVKVSSDPNTFNRWYMCPKVWCPYCEIPIPEADIDPKTIRVRLISNKGAKCRTAICPNGNHQVFIRENESGKYMYPGFLKPSFHPKGLCLPCCYIKPHNIPGVSHYKVFKKCTGEDIANVAVKEGQIYILGKGIPIEKNRYGKLPADVTRLLKTTLDTGYLGFKSGYLRKGIKHVNNNSFLSAISDILNLNMKLDLNKIRNILIEKLNVNIFKSLYAGNLQNIFHNPKNKLSALENFKNYILNNDVEITYKYLWDFLQRPGVLFEEGINIFIFRDNELLCPFGENIKYFYDKNKKSIILINHKEYYEPVYYLEGDGKGASIQQCIFDSSREEIQKLFEISLEGCNSKFNIDWMSVLKDNIKKYDLTLDNITLGLGYDLQTVLNEILINIKNKRLNNGFIPNIQYVDSYNKVFALKLNNGLYIPIVPSRLIEQLKYKVVLNTDDIDKSHLKDIIKYNNELIKKTNLKVGITHKVLDLKNKRTIIAVVNEYNRFIPIKEIVDDGNKELKISNLNFYSDVDEALDHKIQHLDNRIEQMNKKNFEDETYIRMKFDLSKFLTKKINKQYMDNILDIINSDDKNIIKNRIKMKSILNTIYKELISVKDYEFDINNYKTPNKRIPCFLRKDLNNIKLSCNSDPHCIYTNNKCKLIVNKHNLLESHKKFDNYDYYISKIVDELLRFKLKRNEILNDTIPNIINKELIEENPNRYIIIHTLNYVEINNIIDKLFLDNKGIYLDNRNLYEETATKEIGFNPDRYIKSEKLTLNKYEPLTIHWSKLFGDLYKIKISYNDTLFGAVSFILGLDNNSHVYTDTDEDIQKISDLYNINIIILDKRLKKNRVGYKIYMSKGGKIENYIILYKTITSEYNKYYIIQSKNKNIYKLTELPDKFVKYIDENMK